MAEAGGYLLAEALGRADKVTANETLIVKTHAAEEAQKLYLQIVNFWKNKLSNDANAHVKSDVFQADDNAANAAQSPANSLVQQEEGVATNMPQNMANILRACTDIIGLFSFVSQLQSSQS